MVSILKEHRPTHHQQGGGERYRELEVYVVFTDVRATLCALRTAAQLAQGLTSRIRLLLVETVPHQREVDSPPRDICFLSRHFRTLIGSCSNQAASRSIETLVEILLCRDAFAALNDKLPANSVVVLGKRLGWWPRREDRMAKRLRAAGHHVVMTTPTRAPRLPQFGWNGPVPADLLTGSASGLDHHISPASAHLQVTLVAKARGLAEATLQELVNQFTEGRDLGLLGEPRVNVLLLKRALDERNRK